MGMYTELNIRVNLRADTPENVINILRYMLRDIDEVVPPDHLPDHPLFSTDRWAIMLICDSHYFDGYTDSSMVRNSTSHEYQLNVYCNFKNYCNEIDLFLDFIRPYLRTKGFLGYTRYEEWDDPMLIYNDVDKEQIEYH